MMHAVELMSKKDRKETFNDLEFALRNVNGAVFTNENAQMAVAIMPDTPFGKGDMYKVAISYCNPRDKFKRKIGAIIAMERLMWEGEYIKVRRITTAFLSQFKQSQFEIMEGIANDMFETFNY
jgi:hypothetical protein